MYHKLEVGIEHLMTGIVFEPTPGHAVQFTRVSPSMVMAVSDEPFTSFWPHRNDTVTSHSTPCEFTFKAASYGEVEWYAQVVGEAMRKCEERLYDMQTYSRTADYTGADGQPSRYAPKEPSPFPVAVVDAMRRKHGKDAAQFLAMLRWAGDHWYYNHDRMYIGVEPDGYIHT